LFSVLVFGAVHISNVFYSPPNPSIRLPTSMATAFAITGNRAFLCIRMGFPVDAAALKIAPAAVFFSAIDKPS
jgi:hypothetical protein